MANGRSVDRTRSRKPGLRADIQGMRAIAVLSVIAAHAQLGPFAGGFVGVDVFFVISGFLITQLLTREVERTGRLSILGFYARRARRILPAATLVLVATAVASALWLGAVQAPTAFADIGWAAFFAVNVRFAGLGTDYFAQDLPPSPVQHFWSLAVEEQFYLVWPLVMVLLLLAARTWGRAASSHRVASPRPAAGAHRGAGRRRVGRHGGFLVAIGLITVASFCWSVLRTSTDPSPAYFSTLTRAWELGLGALGALWIARRAGRPDARAVPRPAVEATAALGVASILAAVLVFDDATPFPGWRAALPVAGSLALLVSGGLGGRPSLVGRALGVRPLRVVGDWSYSLYLWHWPLLVIPVQYLGHRLDLVEKLGVLALAFVLSALSYRFVENPFRSAAWALPSWRSVAVYPATVALVLASCAGAGAYVARAGHGAGGPIALGDHWRSTYRTKDAAVALVKASVRAARHQHPVPAHLRPRLTDLLGSVADVGACDYDDDSIRTVCPRGDVDADRTIVVVGNSHARHWIPAFDKIAARLGYRMVYLVKVRCVGALVTPERGKVHKPFTDCVDFHDWAIDQVRRLQPDLVVLSTSPTNRGVYDDDGGYHSGRKDVDRLVEQGYRDMLDRLRPLARRTVLLADIPYVDGDPGACLSSRRGNLRSCLMHETDAHVSAVADQVEAAHQAGVEAVPTRQWFCAGKACPSVVGDLVPHRDPGHMTNEYSAHLARELASRLGLSAGQGDTHRGPAAPPAGWGPVP